MELFYRQYGGKGEVLVILHGMLGMSDNWVHFARKLEKEYRIFLPDMRNHGKSPHAEEHTYRRMARDLYEFTEQHELSEIILAGHSMGGKIAMQYAADYPDRVKKLIVLDIAPRAYRADEFENSSKINHHKLLIQLSELNLKQFGTREQISAYFEHIPQADRIKYFLQKNIKKSNSGGFEFKFSPTNLLKNIENISGKPAFGSLPFKKPVLFVKGERSDYVTVPDFEEIKSLYPNSQIATISDAGHILHAEKPAELLLVLKDFFEK